ncbi:hypothetical protein BLNAU_15330 [Blattamonas nauphoetae]|uniref:Protein kinase domain-containing protein n=1 Tax=Blattamonas nauphoetae TaxID=2049346 RepID=A0ABQ9XCU0_9EUKA|nr:hypothetical protein BLNAU_15330 [Blattamonas nauphoetae]
MTEVFEVPDGYSFVRTISSGSFGSVVEMIENSTQIHYAGKMIPCMAAKDKERIDREVNRLLQFAHPGIVKLKEFTLMGNMKVIVMELGEQSLADIVRDHTSRGVLVAREVCDLGAAESDDVSSTRSVMSQLYVSPERMESETGRATCSSDVWALGIVLHWLLFGEPPFKSKSLLKLGQEISSFRVSQIGSDCGGEERALLMRMLDPNPETRVTSRQLCSFGVFRCLVNTPSALWRLKDVEDKEHLDKEEKWITSEQGLHLEKEKLKKAEIELRSEMKKLKNELEMEKNARKLDQERIIRLERELAESKSNQTQPPLQSSPHSSGVRSNGPLASSAARHGTVGRSQIGAVVIELFKQRRWKVSGNLFTKGRGDGVSLVSFEFGAEVARMSLTIRKGPNDSFIVGIISSHLSNKALTDTFTYLTGGAGWDLYPNSRDAKQNSKRANRQSACLGGREGQRVVLEADGREGKRTLKLSQDGETQPVFFTNIPVPFRFAVYMWRGHDAVEIQSAEVVSSPQMVGGMNPVPIDE